MKTKDSDLITVRDLKVRVKSSKGRKIGSIRWLERQLNDPYVRQARINGYRSRSAFKLIELDNKFNFLVPGAKILDLGAAPGGWSQIAAQRTNSGGQKKRKLIGKVFGIDIKFVKPLDGVNFKELDFLDHGADLKILEWLNGSADVVLSDMAPSSSGHKKTDHLRIVALCEAAAELAFELLSPGGTFVAKVLAGGTEAELQKILKSKFNRVANVKPKSSRSDSSEKFVVAKGFQI